MRLPRSTTTQVSNPSVLPYHLSDAPPAVLITHVKYRSLRANTLKTITIAIAVHSMTLREVGRLNYLLNTSRSHP
jgi:hypothetical protein